MIDFVTTTRATSEVITGEDGVELRITGTNRNAQAAAEFLPLSLTPGDFEMEAEFFFPEGFTRDWARVGLIAFTHPHDEESALVQQGLGFVLINPGESPTAVSFQNGLTGATRIQLQEKNGFVRQDLAGKSVFFHVIGTWNESAKEWTFQFTVRDENGVETTIAEVFPTEDPELQFHPELFTGTHFGFGAGGGTDPRGPFSVQLKNFSIRSTASE